MVPLLTGRVLLFLVSFLPGFGAVSKGASVFPLKEAWCSLLAGCDNGPHMVVLQRLTKTWGLGAWAQAPGSASSPSNRPIKRSSSQSFVWAFSLCLSFAGPFVLLCGVPVPQRPLPQLCSLHLQYASNKYSRNAMNASLSVSVNVPKQRRRKRVIWFHVTQEVLLTIWAVYWADLMIWINSLHYMRFFRKVV